MATWAITQGIKAQIGEKVGEMTKPASKINWEDFNYPPICKLFHYNLDEVEEPLMKRLVRILHWTFLGLLILMFINLITSIWQTAIGLNKLAILYTLLTLVMLSPLALYVFYRGYRGLADDESLLKFYKILHGFLILWYMVFSILGELSFNGWIRVAYYFAIGNGGLGAFGIIESFMYLALFLLGAYCIWQIHIYKKPDK